MRTQTWYIALLLFATTLGLLLAGCAGGQGPTERAAERPAAMRSAYSGETGVVMGQMISLRDRAPVADVRVTIGDLTSVAGPDGKFALEYVPCGTQWLTVDGGDYAILGGPIRLEVGAGVNDIGQVVLDFASTAVPPAVPTL